jgi:hypothetical protein
MLFGSAVVVVMLLAGSGESRQHRSATHLWLESDTRPKPFDLTPRPPIDFRSVKICGANGLGAFAPITPDFGVGAALTSYRLNATQRAAQFVIGVRVRF